jgi:type I restriction enzyme S subunit
MRDELPDGWVDCEVGDIARIVGGGTPTSKIPSNFSVESGVPWLTPADLSDHQGIYISHGKRYLTSQGYATSSAKLMPKGSVLFSSRAPIGYVAVAENEICTNQGFKSFVCSRGIWPEYLYFWLKYAKPLAEQLASGTTFAEISGTNAARIPLCLAPTREQQRIAVKLEKLLNKVDVCQKRLTTIPMFLKRLRQSVLAAACSGRLTVDWREEQPNISIVEQLGDDSDALPSNWRSVCVGDVIENLKYGTSQKCGYTKHGVPVLRIPNVLNGVIDQTDLKYAQLPPKEFEQLRLQVGDILLIRSNGSVSLVGRSALVREQERGLAYAGYLIRLRPNRSRVESGFLNFAFGSFDVRLQIELEARSTSGVNNINSEEVRALRLSLPPLAEQREIVRRVKGLFALADTIEDRYREAQKRVDHLSQSILAKAFQGDLVPTEAELAKAEGRSFESAEKLLERIKHTNGTETEKKRAHRSPRAKKAAV